MIHGGERTLKKYVRHINMTIIQCKYGIEDQKGVNMQISSSKRKNVVESEHLIKGFLGCLETRY